MWFLDDDDDEEELNVDDLPDDDEEEDTDDEESDEEDEDEEESDDEEDEKPVKSRAQTRIQKLNNARREAERKNLELEQQLAAAKAQTTQQNMPQNNAAARAAYINSLPPEQRAQAEFQISVQEHRQSMALHEFKMADTADKSAFDAKAINNPLYARYAARVEARLQELRTGQNITAPREEVLKHLLGEAMLKVKGKVTSKAKAKKSVDRNSQKPSSSKKTDMNSGSRKGKTAKDRLAGVTF